MQASASLHGLLVPHDEGAIWGRACCLSSDQWAGDSRSPCVAHRCILHLLGVLALVSAWPAATQTPQGPASTTLDEALPSPDTNHHPQHVYRLNHGSPCTFLSSLLSMPAASLPTFLDLPIGKAVAVFQSTHSISQALAWMPSRRGPCLFGVLAGVQYCPIQWAWRMCRCCNLSAQSALQLVAPGKVLSVQLPRFSF